jgi:hypothetical protein
MGWRLHLTNQTIHRLHILPGQPTLLAVWLQPARIHYFELEGGAPLGERALRPVEAESPLDTEWVDFVAGLVAPNRAVLPQATTPLGELYLSNDAALQVIHRGGAELTWVRDGQLFRQRAQAERLIALALDRYLGLTGALDEAGRLHLWQQENPIGVFDIGLRPRPDLPCSLAISQGGGSVFATDGQQVVRVDSSGQVSHRLRMHYDIRRLDCAANGRLIMTCDMETNVLRGYDGADLSPLYQRHAVDLLAQAAQLQLIADMPPAQVALHALAISNKGLLAFTLAGVVCVSEVTEMNRLPRSQKLV